MRTLSFVRGIAAFSLPSLALGAVFDLGQLKWTLKNVNGSIAIPGTVPSQAHVDLKNAGIITEPLLGINGMYFFVIDLEDFHELSRFHGAMGCQ